MLTRFLHKRDFGTIQVDDDGGISIVVSNLVLKQKIVGFIQKELKPPVKTQHAGINEIKETYFKRKLENKIQLMEEELDIWIWKGDKPLQNSPWFATENFNVLKYNKCPSNAWYIIEDVATGCQAFYKSWSKMDSLLWLPTSLESVAEDWQDCHYQIDDSGEAIDETRYTFLRWNGEYGDEAIFVVRDNFENRQSLFTPERCENLNWREIDLSNEPEYKEWSDFGDETAKNLESIIFP